MTDQRTSRSGAKRPFQTSAASDAGVLRDRNDLKLLTGCADFIPNSFAHQKPCHWGYEGNRTGLRVRFVLSHDTIFLYAPIAAPEGHRAPKGNSVGWRRIGDDLSRPNSRRKVAHITQRDCRLPPSFINVLDLLRRLVPLAGLVELKFKSLQSRFRNKVRMR